MSQRWVTASDGVRLAVHEHGEPTAPTVVCVHGFPDDHRVWDGVVRRLADRFHVVTYDVRGSGASDVPRRNEDYRLPQLAADLTAVADAVSPDAPVHVLAHDWGSVQSWHTVTVPETAHRFASLTSISGPDLDHTGRWFRAQLRPGPRKLWNVTRQSLASGYVGFFHLPGIAELACRAGLLDAVTKAARRLETGEPPEGYGCYGRGLAARNRAGLKLYRANVLPRTLRPRLRHAGLPAQVLAPRRDMFVLVPWQTQITDWAPDTEIHVVDGGHWLPAFRPDLVAEFTARLVDRTQNALANASAPETRNVQTARKAGQE
ncbi:alpha/beta fold hydrolase [Streptomyces sp. H10-C2]|uniref:alpha/beta fold hydrolase n=1 Tax=unclassified Streptomyces TaxID=2593676 RepID=UPI0024B8FC19|nr:MULTISPECIES: alpha/beta fold hydrolase [unclassified Streptomyces]MDJ0344002.1 alpha/beta fold hydrolase [Streptomyces sp. PH10-H1]MDJ0373507.1 alpha/beta fold hydrolase [Streptomyces sp. H10-C2]